DGLERVCHRDAPEQRAVGGVGMHVDVGPGARVVPRVHPHGATRPVSPPVVHVGVAHLEPPTRIHGPESVTSRSRTAPGTATPPTRPRTSEHTRAAPGTSSHHTRRRPAPRGGG